MRSEEPFPCKRESSRQQTPYNKECVLTGLPLSREWYGGATVPRSLAPSPWPLVPSILTSMKILALDTATEACSAALLCDGSVYERHEIAPRRHAELILPMVDAVLAQAGLGLNDLDAIAFGRGPGAFTGVRIAAGVTQGLALGADLPVIPVSSLAALAQPALGKATIVLPAIDARMGEVYWTAYEPGQDGLVSALVEEQVTPPDALQVPSTAQIFGVGSGWGTYRERLERVLPGQVSGTDPERFPLAQDMLPLAVREYQHKRYVAADQALPVYLRDKVVKQG